MTVVADESVDAGIIIGLRQKGFTVIAISEGYSGIKDEEVLGIAVKNECILITEDKDFGELAYRLKHKHYGIILIRLSDMPRKERIELASEIIVKNIDSLSNHFSVLTKRGLRIKHARI
jgi:predicted nuclease of predicted toxin-antitoxin system